jgi:hypothetical protein
MGMVVSRTASQRSPRFSSITHAYEKARSLMQEFMVFAPNPQLQHSRLTTVLQLTEEIPLDYASYLVHAHHPGYGFETLERGRRILRSELRVGVLLFTTSLLSALFWGRNPDVNQEPENWRCRSFQASARKLTAT